MRQVAMPSSSLALALAALAVPYYPPAGDSWYNLTWAVNGTGAPGVYNSSVGGVYNWCSMPHTNPNTYALPTPPGKYELVYVEAIQRHHKRTPYAHNLIPDDDLEAWTCPEGPYAHARGWTGVYWRPMAGGGNPFAGRAGCGFPALTSAGLSDAHTHGQHLRAVYHDRVGFLPESESGYAFRVTNNVLTSETLGAFVAGVYPQVGEVGAWVQSAQWDSLEPTFACPLASRLRASLDSSPEWAAHLAASADVRARFDAVVGTVGGDWYESWDHPYDNLAAKQCHQLPLPCTTTTTNTSHTPTAPACIAQADADTIYRLGQWEWAYRWRGSRRSTLYAALTMGAWFGELRENLVAARKGSDTGGDGVVYRHNFAHDGSLGAVLGVLQAAYPVWPGMGAEVVFELWRRRVGDGDGDGDSDDDGPSDGPSGDYSDYRLRVLWGGTPLATSTPLGVLDMVPLDAFINYLDETIPRDLVGACLM